MNLEDIDIENVVDELTDDGYFVHHRTRLIICLMDEFKLNSDDAMKLCNIIENFDYKFPDEITYDESDAITKFRNLDSKVYFLHGSTIVESFYEAPLHYAVRTGKIHAALSRQRFVTADIDTAAWVLIREYIGFKRHGVVIKTRKDYEDCLWTYDECRFKKAFLD